MGAFILILISATGEEGSREMRQATWHGENTDKTEPPTPTNAPRMQLPSCVTIRNYR